MDLIDNSVSVLFSACHNDVVKVVELACKHDVVVIPFGGKCIRKTCPCNVFDLLAIPLLCS